MSRASEAWLEQAWEIVERIEATVADVEAQRRRIERYASVVEPNDPELAAALRSTLEGEAA